MKQLNEAVGTGCVVRRIQIVGFTAFVALLTPVIVFASSAATTLVTNPPRIGTAEYDNAFRSLLYDDIVVLGTITKFAVVDAPWREVLDRDLGMDDAVTGPQGIGQVMVEQVLKGDVQVGQLLEFRLAIGHGSGKNIRLAGEHTILPLLKRDMVAGEMLFLRDPNQRLVREEHGWAWADRDRKKQYPLALLEDVVRSESLEEVLKRSDLVIRGRVGSVRKQGTMEEVRIVVEESFYGSSGDEVTFWVARGRTGAPEWQTRVGNLIEVGDEFLACLRDESGKYVLTAGANGFFRVLGDAVLVGQVTREDPRSFYRRVKKAVEKR